VWKNRKGAMLQKFDYTEYDSVGNIKKMTDIVGFYYYTYDNLYQLRRVDYPVRGYEQFSYDGCGNRFTYTTNIEGYTNQSYTYNRANEMVSKGGVSCTYNGNMVLKFQ